VVPGTRTLLFDLLEPEPEVLHKNEITAQHRYRHTKCLLVEIYGNGKIEFYLFGRFDGKTGEKAVVGEEPGSQQASAN
jgi:hypothetical protein